MKKLKRLPKFVPPPWLQKSKQGELQRKLASLQVYNGIVVGQLRQINGLAAPTHGKWAERDKKLLVQSLDPDWDGHGGGAVATIIWDDGEKETMSAGLLLAYTKAI